MTAPDLEDQLVKRLAAFAAARLGFSDHAIRPDAVRRALREALRRGSGSLEELARRLQAQDRGLLDAVRDAVLVGETYFFRQVEHFRLLAAEVIPRLASRPGPIRAWSAGCSTGEEAYSLAACLLAARPAVEAEVLGTDVSAASLQVARAGVYSRWSSRESAPPLAPVHRPHGTDGLQVLDEVAALTRFAEHNLLEPARPLLGQFDVIFCRNVLSYFSAPAARGAVDHLVDALAPGGHVFFGATDMGRPPPGLEEVPCRGLQVFRKPEAPGRSAASPRSLRPPGPSPLPEPAVETTAGRAPAGGREGECVELHVRALARIELGRREEAERDLDELRRRAPGYLPGLLELSLLHLRGGRRGPAEELMREVLQRAEGRASEEICPGPEPLPVSYYRTAARALLSGPGAFARAGGGGEP